MCVEWDGSGHLSQFVLRVTVCYSKGRIPALFCVAGIDHCDQRQLRVRKGLF